MKAVGTSRWWAMGAMTLGVLAVGLDGTILTIALLPSPLPCTQRRLICSGSPPGTCWSWPQQCCLPVYLATVMAASA